MVIEIPNWVLWAVGIPLGIIGLIATVFFVWFVWAWQNRGGNWF